MSFDFKTIGEAGNLSGTAVVLADFNVPIQDGKVADSFRIDAALPTLKLLLEKGLRIVLLSHLGSDGKESLSPVADCLRNVFPVAFADSIEEAREKLEVAKVVLLQNIRRFSGEMENSPVLAGELASLGDIFINEGFSVSHRAHASVVGIAPLLPSFAGLLFEKEVRNLEKSFNPKHPFVFLLGGKKTETKIPLIEKFLPLADKIFVGGALANAFWKISGFQIGRSAVSGEELIKREWLNDPKIVLPKRVVVEQKGDRAEIPVSEVGSDDRIMDAGKGFSAEVGEVISGAKFLVWNGSFGVTEEGFKETLVLAKVISESGVESIVGGGDTVSALREAGLLDKFSFVSTGGGAMLEFLANGTLPGIEALEKQRDVF